MRHRTQPYFVAHNKQTGKKCHNDRLLLHIIIRSFRLHYFRFIFASNISKLFENLLSCFQVLHSRKNAYIKQISIMSGSVVSVLAPSGHRKNVKVQPNTALLKVLFRHANSKQCFFQCCYIDPCSIIINRF